MITLATLALSGLLACGNKTTDDSAGGDTDTDTDTDTDPDTDTDTDTDADGTSYSGTVGLDAADRTSGTSDTCTGTVSLVVAPPAVTGTASCTFAGPFASFGEASGPIDGTIDTKGNVTAIWNTNPSPLIAEMSGTATATDVALSYSGTVDGGGMTIDYTGTMTATAD